MALLPRSHEWYLCLTRGKPFPKVHAPLTSQFRGSIPCTGQTWREGIPLLLRQRRTNHVSLEVLTIKYFQGQNDVLGKFSWLLWRWAILPLDPSRMISWHQALNAWPGWLILWFMSPTHTFNLQLTWSFSQVKVTFVSTFFQASSSSIYSSPEH